MDVVKVHTIVELREDERGPCFTTCECGVTVHGARPETTEELYRAHRKAVGAPTRNIADNLGLGNSYFGTSATPVLR